MALLSDLSSMNEMAECCCKQSLDFQDSTATKHHITLASLKSCSTPQCWDVIVVNSQNILFIVIRTCRFDRAFPVAAARVWNMLPPAITSLPSLQTFKRALKTELFRRSYDNAHQRQQQYWHWPNTWHLLQPWSFVWDLSCHAICEWWWWSTAGHTSCVNK